MSNSRVCSNVLLRAVYLNIRGLVISSDNRHTSTVPRLRPRPAQPRPHPPPPRPAPPRPVSPRRRPVAHSACLPLLRLTCPQAPHLPFPPAQLSPARTVPSCQARRPSSCPASLGCPPALPSTACPTLPLPAPPLRSSSSTPPALPHSAPPALPASPTSMVPPFCPHHPVPPDPPSKAEPAHLPLTGAVLSCHPSPPALAS